MNRPDRKSEASEDFLPVSSVRLGSIPTEERMKGRLLMPPDSRFGIKKFNEIYRFSLRPLRDKFPGRRFIVFFYGAVFEDKS